MTAMATEKMGIMATGCGVHIATAIAMEKIEFFKVFSIAVATAVWTNLKVYTQ